jgi:hypothetical protein
MSLRQALFLVAGLLLAAASYVAMQPLMPLRDCDQGDAQGTVFLDYINTMSEARARADAATRGLTTTGSWEDWQSRYDFLNDPKAQGILESPESHLAAASRVVAGADYDNTQKMVTVIAMQRLPIGQYVCFMKQVNRALDQGTLKDPRIAAQALLPDAQLKGTTLNYWWHPTWRAEFQRHAARVLTQEQISRVLSGKLWFRSL